MTIVKGPSTSNINLSDTDEKNLEFLLEAFGSMISPEDMASAYCEAGYDLNKASEILYGMLGSSSNNDKHVSTDDLTRAPASSVGVTAGTVSDVNGAANYARSSTLINEPATVLSRSKLRTSGISVGTVSSVIGSDYGRFRAKSKKTCETTKPVKLMSNEVPASQIWVEKRKSVNNAPTETKNMDTDMFLLQMLGDGFQLDIEVIREVLGGCGYDIQESMEKLMNMSAPTLDLGGNTNTVDQTSTCTQEDLGTKFEEQLQFSDSSGRSNVEKEILGNLFTVSERSEMEPRTTVPRRQPRIRKYGLVTGPLEDLVIELKTPIVMKEVNGDGKEKVEDNYETLREAVMEHWVTMKQYYRAAADAYAKGNYELSYKLVEEGHFYMAKAREADETSTKILTQNSDDGEVISINLNDYDPKEAIRLLKTQLKSMSGIPSIHYLKVMVGTNDKDKPNARKRLISKLLERDAITWTEEQDGQIMAIRIDVINPKRLSFNKS